MLSFTAHRHSLWEEAEEKICGDILKNSVTDTSNQLASVFYSPDIEKLKHEYLERLPEKMKFFSHLLGKRPQFAGDMICLLLASLTCTVYLHPNAWMCGT